MYACPMEPFQPPARPAGKPRLREGNLPAFASLAEVDAWIEAHKLPHVEREPGVFTEREWREFGAKESRRVRATKGRRYRGEWRRGAGGVLRAT